jgi:circadian clock protein KaiC
MTGEQQLALHMHELRTFRNQQSVSTFLILAQAGIFELQMVPRPMSAIWCDSVLLVRYFEFNGQSG